jgi:hypothetical protein
MSIAPVPIIPLDQQPSHHAPGPRPARIARAVLLACELEMPELQQRLGVNVLQIRVDAGHSVLQSWAARVQPVLGEGASLEVASPAADRGRVAGPHADPLRGSAGVLRDLTLRRDEGTILAIEPYAWLACGLEAMVIRHQDRRADATVARNPDGTSAGVFLIEPRVLALVPPLGYMDILEQLFPRAQEAGMGVFVHDLPAPGRTPLRTTADLERAAGLITRSEAGRAGANDSIEQESGQQHRRTRRRRAA